MRESRFRTWLSSWFGLIDNLINILTLGFLCTNLQFWFLYKMELKWLEKNQLEWE